MSAVNNDAVNADAVNNGEEKVPAPEQAARKTLRYIDDRMGSAGFLKRSMDKVFPDHWSFMLGEIALYSFVILLLTGVYLTFFFHASQREVIYNGSYGPLRASR
jgi:ubiquinol-cytochrome c reductase cytochrome b subunit